MSDPIAVAPRVARAYTLTIWGIALGILVFATGVAPELRENGVGGRGLLGGFEVVEADADRHRDAFAADDAFAVAQRRDRIEEAARALRHRRQ